MNKMYYIAKVNQLQYTINRIKRAVEHMATEEELEKILYDNSRRIEEIDNHADDESYFI